MKYILFVVLAFSLLLKAGCDSAGETDAPPPPPPPPITLPEGFVADIFASDLSLPTSLAFAPDGSGRLFVNELQTGRIRIVQDGELLPAPFATVQTHTTGDFPVDGENGLLGLAFDPNYAANRYVYITYAERTSEGTFGTVARLTDVNNRGEDFTVLMDGIPCAPGHQIESLAFGPDGKLYVSTGDAYQDAAAQDLSSPLGKILRLNPDGSIPDDNPFPGSPAYAVGLRNSYDLAFHADGTLYAADNGTFAYDELNRIEPGSNLGWPLALGPSDEANLADPVHAWPGVVSPNGMLFYRGTQFPESYRGKLFLVLFGATFSDGPSSVAKRVQVADVRSEPLVFEDFAVYEFEGLGNPLDITEGPDGSLYLADIFQGTIYRIRYAP